MSCSHLNRNSDSVAPAFLLCAISCLAACNIQDTNFEQKVRVISVEAGRPVPGITFGLFNTTTCEGSHATGITNDAGIAKIDRIAMRGKYAILLEELTLCERIENVWRPVWSSVVDPPNVLLLECQGRLGQRSCEDYSDPAVINQKLTQAIK